LKVGVGFFQNELAAEGIFWPDTKKCGILSSMGNKDARRREVKKPKKKKPVAVVQSAYRPPVKEPPKPS
jgi:hypothetical protein